MTDRAASLLVVAGRVATLTLDRPDRMNAFDVALHGRVRAALDRVESDDGVRALVLTGAGRAFCAGQDLRERAATFAAGDVPDLGASLGENYNPLISRIARLPIPVVAAVNGVAAGAGAALALACDIVLAAPSASFQFAFARVALGPDSGTSWLLPRAVGSSRARALALTADAIDAAEAERIGLVWRVVEADVLPREAQATAERLADGPREALAGVKRLMRESATGTLDTALDAERDAQARLGASADFREAVTAFAAKRAPRFR